MSVHILVTEIDWDTDGHPPADCLLPRTVLAVNAPYGHLGESYEAELTARLDDVYGFRVNGFKMQGFAADVKGSSRRRSYWKPETEVAVIDAPRTRSE